MFLRFLTIFLLYGVIHAAPVFAMDGIISKNERAQKMGEAFALTLSNWETVLDEVSAILNKDDALTDEEMARLQERLKELKNNSFAKSITIADSLRSQNDLLKALGNPPEDGAIEDEAVKKERARLNEEIARIDAQLKQTKLVVAKSEDSLKALSDMESEKLRNKLMTRQFLPLNSMEVTDFVTELYDYAAQFNNWLGLGASLFALLILSFATIPLTKHVNQMLDSAKHIELRKKMSRKRVIVVVVAAYFAALLRFGVVSFDDYPALEYLVKVTSAIALASVLYMGLGKFRFIDPRNTIMQLGEDRRSYSWLWNGVRQIARVVLALIPVMSLAGYINLSLYLGLNILATIMALLAFTALRSLVVFLNRKISEESQKKDEKLSPLAITLIEPVLALMMIGFASFFWGLTSDDVTGWIEKYQNGIPIGDITIDFGSIGAAIAMFFALYVFTKVSQWFLASRVFPHTAMSSGVRDAIIAILGYVGILLAFLVSMGAIGLDLSNLAIVAGALSVGIGFGMQAIFNNFVSGLILLFERPVKVGDWIVVGEHSGVIKKIRVRSTEIETFQNSSIIVPNSQLISETVTNWTLHDRVGRVDIPIGVAYGSDTQHVKKVLLETAAAHKEVRSYPSPQVIFTNFGDSSLDFELRCFIHNIRDVFRVSSELRFDVDAAFRANEIEIPFPQRDVHIIPPKEAKVKTASEEIDSMAYEDDKKIN